MNFNKMGFPQINYAIDDVVALPPAGFAWPADMDAPTVDLLKSKGMYDDPAKGVPALAKSYFELNKAHSAGNMIALPAADAKPEAWDPIYAKMGRPETADKYEAKFGADVQVHAPLLDFAKKLAHQWGVPAGKFQAGAEAWNAFVNDANAKMITEMKGKSEAAVTKIKTDMGEEKYTAAVANAQKAFKVLAAQKLISHETLSALESQVGALPVIELMAALGQRMGGEGSFLNGVSTPTPSDPSQMTPEQAKAELTRLNTDADHQKAYWEAKHPEHATAVKRVADLFAAQHRKAA